MAHYLLDTNHASTLVTLHHKLRQKVLTAISAGHDFSVTVPVITESVFGMSLLPRATANRKEWQELRKEVTCFAQDETDALTAADLQLDMRKKGIQLETVDALIAATAYLHDFCLVTKNTKDYPMPELRLYDGET